MRALPVLAGALLFAASTSVHGQGVTVSVQPEIGYAYVGKYFGPHHTERASDCSSTDALMDLSNMRTLGATVGIGPASHTWRVTGRLSRGDSEMRMKMASRRGCPGTSIDNFSSDVTRDAPLWQMALAVERTLSLRTVLLAAGIGVVQTRTTVPTVVNLRTEERSYRNYGVLVSLALGPSQGALAGASLNVRGTIVRTSSDIYEDTRNQTLSPSVDSGRYLSLLELGVGWRIQF